MFCEQQSCREPACQHAWGRGVCSVSCQGGNKGELAASWGSGLPPEPWRLVLVMKEVKNVFIAAVTARIKANSDQMLSQRFSRFW